MGCFGVVWYIVSIVIVIVPYFVKVVSMPIWHVKHLAKGGIFTYIFIMKINEIAQA